MVVIALRVVNLFGCFSLFMVFGFGGVHCFTVDLVIGVRRLFCLVF